MQRIMLLTEVLNRCVFGKAISTSLTCFLRWIAPEKQILILSVLGLCIEFNRYSQGLVRAPFGKVSPSMSRIRDHPASEKTTGFCDLEESGEWSGAEAHFLRARRRCLQPFVDRLREDLPDRIVVDLTDPVLRSLHLDTVLFSILVDRLIQDQVNPVIGTHEIPMSL